jgi:hypothetical protein
MAFDVYPTPPTTPLPINNGVTTTVAITQRAAPDPSLPIYNKVMYIRIAVSGANIVSPTPPAAPAVSLQADTGDFVQLSGAVTPIYDAPGTNFSDYIGDGQLLLEADNVFQVNVGFNANTNHTWNLRIANNTGANRLFTWVVGSTLAETSQPWLDVLPASLTFNVLVDDSAALPFQVFNRGTAAFTVTGISPALPAGFTLGALPGAILPNTSAPITVTHTPTVRGTVNHPATVTITPTDTTVGVTAGHNQALNITGIAQELEVMLVLDTSGSMAWDPAATNFSLPPGSPLSRFGELREAANQFLNYLAFFGQNKGRFGIARFPARVPGNPSTFDVCLPAPIPAPLSAELANAQTEITNIVPAGSTPMGDGIDRVMNVATTYFLNDALSIDSNRRWMLLMTDGAHNSGTVGPLAYVRPPTGTAAPGTSCFEKKVEVFAVGYGLNGASDVNFPQLQTIAADSFNGGEASQVDQAGITPMTLATTLRDTLKAGLTATAAPLDPTGVFFAGQGEARHEVFITPYDTQAAFSLNWNTPSGERLRLALLTPKCEVITEENAGRGRFRRVRFFRDTRFNSFLVEPDFLQNGTDGTPRHGNWTLLITSPELGGIDIGNEAVLAREVYSYDVLTHSQLRLDISSDKPTYFAGDPITISARLTAAGVPVTDATVLLSTTALDQSTDNWLASLNVPIDAIRRAEELLKGQDSTPRFVKEIAAGLIGIQFPGKYRSDIVPMTDPNGIGLYETVVTDTSTPESYTFYVTAVGTTADGVSFRREGKIKTRVLVRPLPAFTRFDIRYLQQGAAIVTIIPRDRFGNVLLLDPATTPDFGLTVRGGDFTGQLVNNLDGSYSNTLRYDPKRSPAINFLFNGAAIKKDLAAPVANLRYVDRVLKFTLGVEAVKGANKHREPEAALGDIFAKPEDRFVALGVHGELVVSLRGLVILPAADNDVTVFVRPDQDLRPYRVEAFVARHDDGDDDDDDDHRAAVNSGRGTWVKLGESDGVTASFSLRRARVKSATAIRILDLSTSTRSLDRKPLTAPGVNIRGVGVLKASHGKPTNDD